MSELGPFEPISETPKISPEFLKAKSMRESLGDYAVAIEDGLKTGGISEEAAHEVLDQIEEELDEVGAKKTAKEAGKDLDQTE